MFILFLVFNFFFFHNSYNKAEVKAEEADRKVVQLETELADKEQYYEELLEKYNGAKSELDELARQFDEL